MNYNDHKANFKSFHTLIDIDHIQFYLFSYFEAVYDDYLFEYEMNSKRIGNLAYLLLLQEQPFANVSERFSFIPVYLRSNPLSGKELSARLSEFSKNGIVQPVFLMVLERDTLSC